MTGEVKIKNVDEAVMYTIATDVLDFSSDSGISQYTKLARKVDGVGKYLVGSKIPYTIEGDYVPVIFSYPMAVYQNQVYPSIVIERTDISKALGRWIGYGATQYVVPYDGARIIGQDENGNNIYDKYTKKGVEIPFDISYSISILGIFRNQVMDILNSLLGVFAVNGILIAKDSEGEDRIFNVYIDRIGESIDYSDINQRRITNSLDMRVEAGLDYGAYDINEKWNEQVVINRILNLKTNS